MAEPTGDADTDRADADGGTHDADAGADADAGTRDGAYRGLFGAFPYAFRASDSRLFRAYAVAGGLLALLLALGFGVALVVVLANTAGVGGGTFTFVRAFVLTVGLAVVFPVVAPVILAARRHRRGRGSSRYDAALAASGVLFACSLYLAAVVSTPADRQETVTGTLAPVVGALYGLPRAAALAFPVAAAALMYLAHRRFR